MEVSNSSISDVKILEIDIFEDERGFFQETFNHKTLKSHGIHFECLQVNKSLSIACKTIRGLHYQLPPLAQAKLVRVSKGSILDVALDIRKNSPTFGMHTKEILSSQKKNQLFIPKGFAHGFLTLEANTEVEYLVDNYYSRDMDRGIFWNDSVLSIDWGISEKDAVISHKDDSLPAFAEANLNCNWDYVK